MTSADPDFYSSAYSDTVASDANAHYDAIGNAEGRIPNSVEFYRRYPFFRDDDMQARVPELTVSRPGEPACGPFARRMAYYHHVGRNEAIFDDLENKACVKHGILFGEQLDEETFFSLNIDPYSYDHYLFLWKFAQVYGYATARDAYEQIQKDEKAEYRYFCFRYQSAMRKIQLPHVPPTAPYCACLVEFRNFPHVEFILRNSISKLGPNFRHWIVCGPENADMMHDIAKKIARNIHVVVLGNSVKSVQQYNELLLRREFWGMFHVEKILIMQEDSIVFREGIVDFLHYDFVGAPWATQTNRVRVGNGGFSLRSKTSMLEILERISPKNLSNIDEGTLAMMNHEGWAMPPEDVYFCNNILAFNCANIPSTDMALKFSVENVFYSDPVGGHCFWKSMRDWRGRVLALLPSLRFMRDWDDVVLPA